jgi:foldase protein PrsA
VERLKQELKSDNEKGFRLFLDNQKKSEAEFNLVIETNTYLRKIAEPMLAGKITEENLKEAFATLYGETVEVRHIQCSTLQEIQNAKKHLSDGDSFDRVARELSRNENTRLTGGKIPPFSREFVGFPQAFRDAAFALQPGQVSEIVQAEGSYHLIMLEKRNLPKVVKFEDVKDSIRKELYDRATQVTITQLRQQIQADALKVMQIEEPTLKKQLEERLKRNTEIKDQQEIRRQMEKERLNQAAPPGAVAPGAAPAPAPTTVPAPG